MRAITDTMIAELIEQARQLPRLRTIYRLHEHEEPVQRMVNALIPGTYTTPHKHENPDKVELFSILTGKIACLQFSDSGKVEQVFVLDAAGPVKVVDIPPRTWHSLVALEPSAVVEIIQGPYEATTHKNFAPWAPAEGTEGATEYLHELETIIHNWK
ncbi:MAG: WbuC family cupin fold metalloprotein [Anaerolineae bacterium]|nr:WbuC family cupin fold metalloprotein [Anaerolineae bacterium]